MGTDVFEKVADKEGYINNELDPDEYIPAVFRARFLVSERRYQVDGSDILVTASDVISRYPHISQYRDRIIPIDIRGDYSQLDIPIQDVSSSYIRKNRSEGKDVEELEAVGISDFVDRRGLYAVDSLQYAAFVAARERFSQENTGRPPAHFIRELMDHLSTLENSREACEQEIHRLTQ